MVLGRYRFVIVDNQYCYELFLNVLCLLTFYVGTLEQLAVESLLLMKLSRYPCNLVGALFLIEAIQYEVIVLSTLISNCRGWLI